MLTYFERYQMRYEIGQTPLVPSAPDGSVHMLPWRDDLVRSHAWVKYRAFCHEIDAIVFPCLAQSDGCLKLMNDIRGRSNFVPEATLLAAVRCPNTGTFQPVGTIQGLRSNPQDGAIQNVGIIPEYRGRGIAAALLRAAIAGFEAVGCRRVHLEVTTQNTAAIRLYERCGFQCVATVFKASEVPAA